MRKIRKFSLLVIIVLLAFTSCKAQDVPQQKLENELAGIVKNWFKYFNANDADKLVELYDDSAIYASHDFPLTVGKANINELYNTVFQLKPSVISNTVKTSVEGNIGIVLGEFEFKATTLEGKAVKDDGRFLVIYKKFEDGKWRIIYDMDNHPPDVDASKWVIK